MHIFIDREYDIKLNREGKCIIDAGANIGLASLFFLTRWLNVRIIALEPEAQNFDLMIKNLKGYPQVICLQKGLWDSDCFLEVVDNGWGEAGFMVKESSERTVNSVEGVMLKTLMNQYRVTNIDVLKLDIEGSEENILLGKDKKSLNNVSAIFCEVHENLKPGLEKRIRISYQNEFNIFQSGEYQIYERKSIS